MAYMDDMALERERTRQKLLEGKQPLLGDDTARALHALGVSLGVVPPGAGPSQALERLQQLIQAPKGVRVDDPKPLQVAPERGGRAPSTSHAQFKNDDSLANVLQNLLGSARGGGLKQIKSHLERAQERGQVAPGGSGYRPGPGQPGGRLVSDVIPGLKAPIDPARSMPGAPAAAAYQEQTRKDIPALTGVDKSSPSYKADMDYLSAHGGHTSVVKDGKIVQMPVDTKGAYADINPELAARLRAAGEAYTAETGQKPKFGEFSRGEDVQSIYWRDSGGGKKYAAAPPGRSQHQHGNAGDLPTSGFRDWLKKGGGDKHGLHFPVKGDEPHVQINPAFKGTVAAPAGPTVPPMDTAKPPAAAAVDTKWPATTTPALPAKENLAVSEPGGRQFPAPAAEGGVLAEQRAQYKAEADANPSMRETMAAIMIAESGTPEGRLGTAEAMMNRVNARGQPFSMAMDPNYHADYMVRDKAKFAARLAEIRNNPQLKAEVYALQDKAFGGSNVSKLATDYSSKSTAASARTNSTHTFTSPDGQEFFIKDRNPNDHGPKNVADNQRWKQDTESKLRGQPTPAAQPAQAAPANPTPGPAAPPGHAAPATPPEVAVPPAAAAPPAAPPPTAATANTPSSAPVPPVPAPAPPPMAPTAQRPAPVTGIAAAHKILDTKVIDLVKANAPGQVNQVPGFIANKTLREASQMPLVGGQIMTGITPHLKKLGVTPEEFSRALTEKPPAPGKQSSLGTSGATDFSSRGRTPLAPQGLEAGNIDPASQPAVQNADGSISTVRTIGVGEEGGREVNIPTVPQEGGRIMSDQEAVQRYQDTGRHLGKYDSVDAAGRGAEALHQTEAREISQQPKGQQPTITPEMAKAIENAMKDQGRVPQAPVIPPEAQPVLPSQVAPMPGPQGPGGGGGAGLPLAPNGLNTGGFQPGMAMPGSQGGSIAMAGMLPPIQNATFSTPLLDSMATNQPFGSSSLSPIPFETLGGWGWGGGGFGGGGGFDFGGGFDIGGGGLDVGGSGLGMSMMGSLFSG